MFVPDKPCWNVSSCLLHELASAAELQEHAYTACVELVAEYAGRWCCRGLERLEASFVACKGLLVERCSTLEEVRTRKSAIVKQVLPHVMQGGRCATKAAALLRTLHRRIRGLSRLARCPTF